MAKERVAMWDHLKLLLITLVVIGHFADFFTDKSEICRAIFLFVYAFHMPAFFFVSGLFYSNKNVGGKCLFYVSGGVLCRMLLATLSRLFGNPAPAFPLLHEDGLPWFLYVLAAYTALAWLLRRQNLRFIVPGLIALGCFIGYDPSVGDTLCLSRVIVFAPFYFAGVYASPEKIADFRQKHRILPLAALPVLGGWAAACYLKTEKLYFLRAFFTGRHPFSAAAAPYGPLLRLGCYLLAALLCAALIALVPTRPRKGITSLGENTLNVYFWHWPVYMVLEHFFHIRGLFEMGVWGKAGFLALGLALTVLLAAVPVFRFPLKQIRAAIFRASAAKPAKTEETA